MKRIWKFALLGAVLMACSESPTRFERLSPERTGISFNNVIDETDEFNILKDEYMYNGGGVGIGDLNNDGLSDIILTGNKVSTRVYLNQGDFKFTDITESFSGLDNSQWISGVVVVDINHDELLDVYLTSTSGEDPDKRRNKLFVNMGIGDNGVPAFEEKAEEYGIGHDGFSVHAAFLDYDLDGDLDLYILNNTVNKDVPTNYRPKMVDGSSQNNDAFYENNGDGTFTNVTKEAGILIEGFGLGLAVADLNKDGYPDVYVSNDYISNDLMYINQGDKSFKNMADDLLSYQSKFSMGNDISDVNSDGNPDIITLDMLPHEYARKKQTMAGSSYLFYVNDEKYGYQHQYVRNMLQVHNGFLDSTMIPYSEVGQLAGVYDTEWSWSPLFADYDNDGDKDLMITNGFPKDLTDKDFTNYKAQMHNYLASDAQVLSRIPEAKVSNFAYERQDGITYKDVTKEWGMEIPSYSNGAAFSDLDNDGDLDYIVNNIDDIAFVYRNNTMEMSKEAKPDYLQIRLKGEGKNTQAIGAKVEIWAGDDYYFFENNPVRGYISSVDPVMHTGLPTGSFDKIRVIWPGDQLMTEVTGGEINTLVEISQANAVAYANEPSEFNRAFQNEELIDYVHVQQDYIDFFDRQNIMPHKFSQIGPCLAKGDLNNDGADDLLVGASDELPTMAFIQQNGAFVAADIEGLTNRKECLESDMVILDIDGDGDNDVLSVAGGYRNHHQDEYKHYWYENVDGVFTQHQFPIPAFPGSVIRPFDFDKDGDMDLFIGSRIKRDNFPLADPSVILINDNGFSEANVQSFDIGMVTDAVWSDVDGDGWTDLVITRELESVLVISNSSGAFAEKEIPELAGRKGSFSAIVAGDFDNDGDEDYLVGNLGRNHKFNISNEYPLRVYSIDIDDNGVIDPIVTSYWKDLNGEMKEYPVNGLDELASQSPFFRKRFTSYTQFSVATMDSIVQDGAVSDRSIYEMNTTDSYFLWNDAGNLTFEAMPEALQTSPIRKMLVTDINEDGNLDILVTGNDYSYDVSTGFYDANKGIVMMGDGTGKFEILQPRETGFLINGQVDGLIEIESNGETYIIAGVNRQAIETFKKAEKESL